MFRSIVRTLSLAAVLALVTQSVSAEKLPSDERVLTGKLSNGVTWLYRQHDNPPGKMAMLIHVASGSLNETEQQRGLAHFLEHMAFNGSEHFPPGELIKYFESIGMEFGGDVNAFTSFDQTVFMLYLPDTTVEQVDRGLMALGDQAFHLLLLDEEINNERGVIMSELRAGMSAQQRIRDEFFKRLFAGMRLGNRIPIGLEDVIQNAGRDRFVDYYRTWYRPERVTLIMVGDAEVEPYLPLMEKWLGQYQAKLPARPAHGPGCKPLTEERAIILTDAEYSQGDVELYNILPGRPPITTVEQAREELIGQIAGWIMGRRFDERVSKGTATYRTAHAGVFGLMNEALLVNASATGEPKDWEKMLDELILEVNRAREYGFLAREFELCKSDMRSSAERAVRTEPTFNARGMLMGMAASTNSHEPIMSAQQELDLLKRLLPTITLEEVNAAFAEYTQPGAFTYVLTMPKTGDFKLPSEDELLAAGRAAQARKPEPPQKEQRVTTLLEHEPTPGRVVETSIDEELGITSGWLSNGVRFHHRFMDYKKDSVMLSITLAGGQIEETSDNAGVTTVAGLAFYQPATARLDSTTIQDIMTGKNIRVGGSGNNDAFTITVTGSPRDLEIGLQLAYALLTDARIEQSAFDNWKQGALQQYQMATRMAQYHAFETLVTTISGNDPRRHAMLTPTLIEAQTLERAQAWLERLCREAPIEVAVVGEITLDEVRPLLEKYVGSLSSRARGAEHLDKLRATRRAPGPYRHVVEVDTITPQTMALAGFVGCDAVNVRDMRAMNLASIVLSTRMIERIREELGLVYSIGAQSSAARCYEDAGFFFSGAPCEPGTGEQVIAEIEAIFKAFADSGPTADELDNARKQIRNTLDTQLKEPSFWFGQLQTFDLHKGKLKNLKNITAEYESISAEEVRDVFRKYDVPERVFAIRAIPASTPAKTPKAEESAPLEAAPK